MSIFNELLLPKLLEISNNTVRNFNNKLQEALDCLDKFEEEYQNGRGSAKERALKEKIRMTALQSIHEDDDETKNPDSVKTTKPDDKPAESEKRRVSKKRSRDEVEGISSPEQDRRTKRNASVKAQSIISKQKEREILKALDEDGVAFVSKVVNVNLNQKMRREDSVTSLNDKKSKRRNEDDKENSQPAPAIQIKQEKVSLPPEPMDTAAIPVDVTVKLEPSKDDSAMPPPAAPVPKPRKALQKEKEKKKDQDDSVSSDNEETGRKRNTRNRKQNDTVPPPAPVASARLTRASSRASRRGTKLDADDHHNTTSAMLPPPPPEQRPKRTRGRKILSESSTESEKNSTQTVVENGPSSPVEKPRPKRTRRGKHVEKEPEPQKQEEPQTANDKDTATQISPKEERISQPTSPVLQKPKKEKKTAKSKATKSQNDDSVQIQNLTNQTDVSETASTVVTDKPQNSNMNVTVTLEMDKTMVLPNGVYNHQPVTPNAMHKVNETVVLETCRETIVLDKQNINDATVVLDKAVPQNITDDDSLLTDDGSEPEVFSPRTPPGAAPPQPTSAVKEKVQQFEELAARTTRTKTRAMAKMEEDQDTHTPPDKMIKPILSQETLNKMNNMIFNGKPPQVSSASASKPRAIPVPVKSTQPASTSKLSALNKHKDAAEREKEDARKKKEALLEAKRELQKKKREEKMANAAAAREAAERERKVAMEAAARERLEKQQHADLGKLERLKEAERKKLELARKVAETEERRRAEEAARTQRLAQEQKKAEANRKKQLEEADAMKKEALLMAKEIERKQREYLEKQKLKQRLEEKVLTPLKPGMAGYHALSPVYMADGFQFLNSDEEEETTNRLVPAWSMPKARKLHLACQSEISSSLIDTLFSVRVHSPDLRVIFPNIERNRLKRTSSAVWRTPPRQTKLE